MDDRTSAPKLEKYTYKYWTDELRRAKEARADFEEIGQRSINVYKKEHNLEDTIRQIQIWWSTVNTLLPAYFSRIPKVDVSQRKRRGDDIARLTGIAWEASTQYAIEEHFNFQDVGYNSILQFILTGQGVLWARYQAKTEDKEHKYPLIKKDDKHTDY